MSDWYVMIMLDADSKIHIVDRISLFNYFDTAPENVILWLIAVIGFSGNYCLEKSSKVFSCFWLWRSSFGDVIRIRLPLNAKDYAITLRIWIKPNLPNRFKKIIKTEFPELSKSRAIPTQARFVERAKQERKSNESTTKKTLIEFKSGDLFYCTL